MGDSLPSIMKAMDLPAVNRMSVATIGWTLNIDTRDPLNAPMMIPTTQLARKPAAMVSHVMSPARRRTWTNTADVMAAATPTLMSCPREDAVTRVIPIARMTSSEAPNRMFGMFPYNAPLITDRLK